jgi:hypothetical protein
MLQDVGSLTWHLGTASWHLQLLPGWPLQSRDPNGVGPLCPGLSHKKATAPPPGSLPSGPRKGFPGQTFGHMPRANDGHLAGSLPTGRHSHLGFARYSQHTSRGEGANEGDPQAAGVCKSYPQTARPHPCSLSPGRVPSTQSLPRPSQTRTGHPGVQPGATGQKRTHLTLWAQAPTVDSRITADFSGADRPPQVCVLVKTRVFYAVAAVRSRCRSPLVISAHMDPYLC